MKMNLTLRAVCTVMMLVLAACEDDDTAQKKQDAGSRTELALNISDFRFAIERGRNTYYHNRNYAESGGMGATLTRGKVCVENGKICVESAVQYRVEAGKTFTQPDHKVATTLDKDRITIEYWGSADNGEPVHIRRILKTSGTEATVE